jgi:glucose/sorbosone dehydrogenase
VLSGKLLRLDPTPAGGKGYTVPTSNPFVGRGGVRPEIWAYGLRNPWRFSFDLGTGDLWIGDVGQYILEEIDVIALRRSAGANFGWNRLEGRRRFSGGPPPRAVPPIHQYNHSNGRCAVVGGHVYRGTQLRDLQGAYLYGDVCEGRIRHWPEPAGRPCLTVTSGSSCPGWYRSPKTTQASSTPCRWPVASIGSRPSPDTTQHPRPTHGCDGIVVAGGRSRSGSARQRGRSLVATAGLTPPATRPHGHRPAVMVARREGFEPPTARSVVSHRPSPPVLLVPSRPRWRWSTAISPVRFGHASPPVTGGLVAMWSQFQAGVARPGVW